MAKLMAFLALIVEGRERKRMKHASGFCKSDMTAIKPAILSVAFSVLDVAISNYHRYGHHRTFWSIEKPRVNSPKLLVLEKGIRVVPIRRSFTEFATIRESFAGHEARNSKAPGKAIFRIIFLL